jgi:hypothetical protein
MSSGRQRRSADRRPLYGRQFWQYVDIDTARIAQ